MNFFNFFRKKENDMNDKLPIIEDDEPTIKTEEPTPIIETPKKEEAAVKIPKLKEAKKAIEIEGFEEMWEQEGIISGNPWEKFEYSF